MSKKKVRKTSKKDALKKKKAKAESLPYVISKCDVCGAVTREIHCRLVCPNCGASRDCSDP